MMKINPKNLIGLLCCAVILVTTGCSAGNQEVKPSPSGEPLATDVQEEQSEEAGGTRTVSTVMGDIEVPVSPERVVVNWYVGEAFTLGLNVVGYAAWAHEAMPFYDKFEGSVSIENWEPEEVMKLDPDLIITYAQEDFEKFGQIAPVLVIPEGDVTSLERLKLIGEASGRAAEAEAAVSTFEAKLAEAKETLKGDAFQGKTFSITEDWGTGSYGIYYETESRGGTLVYEYLGLSMPEKLQQLIEESGEGRGGLSYEVAADYFGDYMLWFRPYDATEDQPSEYERTELWNTIPAVQEGKVATIPGNMSGLFYYSDVASLTAQLDYIIEKINNLAE